jgi:hypothetical protein
LTSKLFMTTPVECDEPCGPWAQIAKANATPLKLRQAWVTVCAATNMFSPAFSRRTGRRSRQTVGASQAAAGDPPTVTRGYTVMN